MCETNAVAQSNGNMDDQRALLLICQFLDELGLHDTLRSLERERQARCYDYWHWGNGKCD